MNKEPEAPEFPTGSLSIEIERLPSPMLDCSKHGSGTTDLTITVSAFDDGAEESRHIPTNIGCALCYAEAMAVVTAAYRDKHGITWTNQRVVKMGSE